MASFRDEAPPGGDRGEASGDVSFATEHLPISHFAKHTQARNPYAVKLAREIATRLRRQRHVEHLHRLGPSPLGHFLREVEGATRSDVTARLERYAEIDPEFVRALGGDKFAPIVRVIDGDGQ